MLQQERGDSCAQEARRLVTELGIKGILHHAEWTSEKAPNLLSTPSQQMAFAPTDAWLATLLENVKQMSQATLCKLRVCWSVRALCILAECCILR